LRADRGVSADFRSLAGAVVYSEIIGTETVPLVVVAMFTADMSGRAERLSQSLRRRAVDHRIYQVPTVHRSISAKGADDLAFSQANFIRYILDDLRRPVLYVDADIEFRGPPVELYHLAPGTDFAIYNWLADTAATDAYQPVAVAANGECLAHRFFKFAHGVDVFDPSQLLASGEVQFHAPGNAMLLSHWL
jgi:hypothetical protein